MSQEQTWTINLSKRHDMDIGDPRDYTLVVQSTLPKTVSSAYNITLYLTKLNRNIVLRLTLA
jgi:hypothetical protein